MKVLNMAAIFIGKIALGHERLRQGSPEFIEGLSPNGVRENEWTWDYERTWDKLPVRPELVEGYL